MICDAAGTPLVIHTTPANVRDDVPALRLIQRIPPIHGPRGRPRRKPDALVGDRGYGFAALINAVWALCIVAMLARRGSEHGSGLGRVRWVVERTMSWIGNFRRIKFCYERRGRHFQAFHHLAAALICARRLTHPLLER